MVNLTFNQAKKLDEYIYTNILGMETKDIKACFIKNDGNEIDCQGAYQLVLGNVCVELNILQVHCDDRSYYDFGYYICANYDNSDNHIKGEGKTYWESVEYSDVLFKLEDFDNLEESMFEVLVDYLDKHEDLHWDKLN